MSIASVSGQVLRWALPRGCVQWPRGWLGCWTRMLVGMLNWVLAGTLGQGAGWDTGRGCWLGCWTGMLV